MSDTHSKASQPLSELRQILRDARTSDDAERIHAALIEVVDGLISHSERQASLSADLRSDLDHKQGIVTRIGGGDYVGPQDNVSPGKADELDL